MYVYGFCKAHTYFNSKFHQSSFPRYVCIRDWKLIRLWHYSKWEVASYLALQRYYILPPMLMTNVHTKEYTHRRAYSFHLHCPARDLTDIYNTVVSRLTLSFRWPLYSQFQGEILMIINLWTLLLFFSAADSELSCSSLSQKNKLSCLRQSRWFSVYGQCIADRGLSSAFSLHCFPCRL